MFNMYIKLPRFRIH